jgi:hypothetical protein
MRQALFAGLILLCTPMAAAAQDSTATPPWAKRVRYGGGPSIGGPPSSYDGSAPPTRWCLVADSATPAPVPQRQWTLAKWQQISVHHLRSVLRDTTDFGTTWRSVLGGASLVAANDSIVIETDEELCRSLAESLNRELLGWEVGPPPVAVFRVRDYLFAFPSNARIGHFGYAVGFDKRRTIRGVATW